MQDNTLTHLILASISPRRREIIRGLNLSTSFAKPEEDKFVHRDDETPCEYVIRASVEKARNVLDTLGETQNDLPPTVVLSADTEVALNGNILGKPSSDKEATEMLLSLAGVQHTVVTGLTAMDISSGRVLSRCDTSQVMMRQYSDDEVAVYVASGAAMDKAGGYGIQDAEFSPVEFSNGCYLNIVGLSLCYVVDLMSSIGWRVRPRFDWQPAAGCVNCPLTV